MQSVTLRSHVGADGILKLQIPVALNDVDVEVVVVMQPLEQNGAPAATQAEWRAFIEQTAGKWAGEPLVRAPQGDYPVRDEIKWPE